MAEKTSEKILEYIRNKGQATGDDLSRYLGITSRAVRKQLSNLLEEDALYKIGKPPKVFYLLAKERQQLGVDYIDPVLKKVIDENFLIITPAGEKKEGFEGFVFWCNRQKLPVEKTAIEYERTLKKYLAYKKGGLIDGMYKIKHTFSEVFVDKLFYLDFYSIERFGKTKLGQLLLYAKQSQNKILINELVNQLQPQITELLKRFKIDAVAYIPPTVRREVQLMKELERMLNLALPVVNLQQDRLNLI